MLIGDARSILTQLATDDKFKNTHICDSASSCDEPEWAHECLGKIELLGGRIMGAKNASHNTPLAQLNLPKHSCAHSGSSQLLAVATCVFLNLSSVAISASKWILRRQ